MTFDEWFDSEYPPSLFAAHMLIDRIKLKAIAHNAWQAGYVAGVSEEVEWQGYLDRISDT